MTLASLTPGCKYRIDSIDCTHAVVQRLMMLGLVEGTEVELASTAIGGDPVEFRMFGNAISLRLDHARRFNVTPISEGD
jgi:Fe2+ transport system protein FeoA